MTPMVIMSAAFAMIIAAIVITLPNAQAEAQSVARIEVQPVQTITLNTAQILAGDMKGAPATVAGDSGGLRIDSSSDVDQLSPPEPDG